MHRMYCVIHNKEQYDPNSFDEQLTAILNLLFLKKNIDKDLSHQSLGVKQFINHKNPNIFQIYFRCKDDPEVVIVKHKKIRTPANLVNGKLEGEWSEKYPNGQLKTKGHFINDKMEGVWLEYYQIGQLRVKSNYVNDKKEGEWFEYFQNGQIKIKTNYVNDTINGEWLEYAPNGLLRIKRIYL